MTPFSILHSAEEWQAKFGTAGNRATLSVGNFDGLHLGHQKILREVVGRARAAATVAAVVTFDPHPLKVLRPEQAPLLLQTLPQRLAGIQSMGLDAAVILHFDPVLAALPAIKFVSDILVDKLRTATILVGQNFRFGHRQAGDVALLQELGAQFDFAVEIIPPVVAAGEVVSSTAVRRAVLDGRPGDAAQLLGRPFALTGAIEHGSGRGSTILFPTLNLRPDQELLPKTGVYATEVRIAGKLHGAATNVGFRPTFDGTRLSIESHLFDFSEKLSTGRLEVFFWERLRDERKFRGPEELRRQITADLDAAREFLRRLGQKRSLLQRA